MHIKSFRGLNATAFLYSDRVELKKTRTKKLTGAVDVIVPFDDLIRFFSEPPTFWLNGWVYLAVDSDPENLAYWHHPSRWKIGGEPHLIAFSWWQRKIQNEFEAEVRRAVKFD
jgi:hypothetical protein